MIVFFLLAALLTTAFQAILAGIATFLLGDLAPALGYWDWFKVILVAYLTVSLATSGAKK